MAAAADQNDDWEHLPSTLTNRVFLGSLQYQFVDKIRFKEGDDSLKQVSKTVSWVLRHGAESENCNVKMDADKNVLVSDLLEITKRVCGISSYSALVELLKESNKGKRRYAFTESGDGELMIKAVHKFDTIPGTSIKATAVKDTKWAPVSRSGDIVDSAETPARRVYKVLVSDHFEKVIVRKGMQLDSPQIGVLDRNETVWLLGEPALIEDGIVRIKVESHESGLVGWVTQDARKAAGPQFLIEVTDNYWGIQRGDRNHYGDSYDGKGKRGSKGDSVRGKSKGGMKETFVNGDYENTKENMNKGASGGYTYNSESVSSRYDGSLGFSGSPVGFQESDHGVARGMGKSSAKKGGKKGDDDSEGRRGNSRYDDTEHGYSNWSTDWNSGWKKAEGTWKDPNSTTGGHKHNESGHHDIERDADDDTDEYSGKGKGKGLKKGGKKSGKDDSGKKTKGKGESKGDVGKSKMEGKGKRKGGRAKGDKGESGEDEETFAINHGNQDVSKTGGKRGSKNGRVKGKGSNDWGDEP